MSIDGKSFIRVIRPALEGGCPETLAKVVGEHWRPDEVCTLLRDADVDVRRAAAMVVGLIADRGASNCLAQALQDGDSQVSQMAEHSLWSIWFRCGGRGTCKPFREGVALMASESHELAIEKFSEAIAADADFAEAFNQRAIAHFLLGNWANALEDCRETVRRVPYHFGALAGMGLCHIQLGEISAALDAYRRAHRVHPHMAGVEDTIKCLERRIRDANDSSGIYGSGHHDI